MSMKKPTSKTCRISQLLTAPIQPNDFKVHLAPIVPHGFALSATKPLNRCGTRPQLTNWSLGFCNCQRQPDRANNQGEENMLNEPLKEPLLIMMVNHHSHD